MTVLVTTMNAQESGTSDCPLLELSDEHVQLVGQMASPPQIGGTYAPVSGTIRVLIIFARFSDDNYEPNNPNWKLSDTLTNFPEAQNIIRLTTLKTVQKKAKGETVTSPCRCATSLSFRKERDVLATPKQGEVNG